MKKRLEKIFLKVHNGLLFILLLLIYIFVLGPTSVYIRLVKHRKLPQDKWIGSSWVDLDEGEDSSKDYLKQY